MKKTRNSGHVLRSKRNEHEIALVRTCGIRHFSPMTPEYPHTIEPRGPSFGVFQEVAKLLSSSLDKEEVFRLIVCKSTEALDVDAATIRLFDEKRQKLYLAASFGVSEEYLARGPVEDEESVAAAVHGDPVAVFDVESELTGKYAEASRKEGVKSLLTAPVTVRGEVIGILRFLSKKPRQFTEAELEFAGALAEHCGVAIENAKAYENQQRQLLYFKALNDIGKAVNAGLSLREVLDVMVTKLPEATAVKGCTIRLLNSRIGRLELMASSGLSKQYLRRGDIDDEIATHHALQGEPVVIFDAVRDRRIEYNREAEAEGIKSILAVPIIVQGAIIGVLRLLSDTQRQFSDAEVAFTAAAAEHGGIAIRNAENMEKIQKLLTELEQHEEFLNQVVDGMGQELVVLEASGRVAMVNKAFCIARGEDEQHFIGIAAEEVLPFLGDTIPSFEGFKRRSEPHVAAVEQAAGEESRHMEMTASPVSIYGGDMADFVIITMRDVTDREKLQQEHLERTRLEGVLEMAGAVSHEVNTPLFSALGTAELLREDVADNEMLAGDVETIIKNLKTISELTKRIAGITSYETLQYAGGVKIVDIRKA